MQLKELYLDRYLYRDNDQEPGTKDASFASANSSDTEAVPIYSGGAAEDVNSGGRELDLDIPEFDPGDFPIPTLNISNWGWGQTCTFNSLDKDTVQWGSGQFLSASGDTYPIAAGNTEDMMGKVYIYFDINDPVKYQQTTIHSTAVGLGKVLVAVATPAVIDPSNPGNKATYVMAEATQIIGDNILANTIDVSKLVTGQLIVGTNVGLGDAVDENGVTVIVDGYISTKKLTAEYVVANINIETPNITGGVIQNKEGAMEGIKISDEGLVSYGESIYLNETFTGTRVGYLTTLFETNPANNGYQHVLGLITAPNRDLFLGAQRNIITASEFLIPRNNNETSLGAPNYKWKNIYGVDANITNKLVVKDLEIIGSVTGITISGDYFANFPFVQLPGDVYFTPAEVTIGTKVNVNNIIRTDSVSVRKFSVSTVNRALSSSFSLNSNNITPLVLSESDSATTIYISDSVNIPVGTHIDIVQTGLGEVTFSSSGINLYSKDGKRTINGRNVGVTLIKTDDYYWHLFGDLK